jgi:DNA-binding NtrC family response regulator
VDGRTSVLIIDDDPMHLRIYGWIIGAAGYEALPAQVIGGKIGYPEGQVDLVVMDYRLTNQLSAVQAAQETQRRYPKAPIVVLSDMYDLPEDIAPYARSFVRKGEPAKLVETLAELSGAAGSGQSNSAAS